MNKKYMDFVPVTAQKKAVKPKTVVANPKPATVTPRPASLSPRSAAVKPKPVVRQVVPEQPAKKQPSLNELDKKQQKMNLPKPAFVNTEKVTKRPLSKNVYQKKVEVPVEEAKAPVKIIDKPEKDSKVGLIVTIIITIILGAAAGTVAFLLLPK